MPPNATLPPAVTQALDRGHLVEAIKLLRASGMDAAALKEAVDGYMRTERPRFEKRAQGHQSQEQAANPLQTINHPADTLRGLSPGQVPESRFGLWWLAAIAFAIVAAWVLSGCASRPVAPVAELAPSGKLRAAINFGNPILASRGSSGEARGLSVDLAREAGRRLGVPVELVTFEAAGRVVDAVKNAQVDIGFVAIDPVRGADMLQTQPYVIIEGAFLVKNGSPLTRNEEVDRAGTRVVVGNGSAYDLYLTRELKNARLEKSPTSPTVVDTFVAQNADVAAGVRQQLEMDAKRLPGLRVLPGRFMVIEQAMGLPKGRPNGQAWLRDFLEEMKSSGFVAGSLWRHGIEGAVVAPALR